MPRQFTESFDRHHQNSSIPLQSQTLPFIPFSRRFIDYCISEPSSSTERSNGREDMKIFQQNDFETEKIIADPSRNRGSSSIVFDRFEMNDSLIEHLFIGVTSYRIGLNERIDPPVVVLEATRRQRPTSMSFRVVVVVIVWSRLRRRRLTHRIARTHRGPRDKVIRINWPLIN